MTEIERKLKEKSEIRKAKRAQVVHNDVDKYLSDPNEGEEEENFDILNWWRNEVSKYPILAHVAREILAIPISTIALKSSFSTSGWIIDSYHSFLSPKMVEALICTQNWLSSIYVALHHELIIEEMKFREEVEKGDEVVVCITKSGEVLSYQAFANDILGVEDLNFDIYFKFGLLEDLNFDIYLTLDFGRLDYN